MFSIKRGKCREVLKQGSGGAGKFFFLDFNIKVHIHYSTAQTGTGRERSGTPPHNYTAAVAWFFRSAPCGVYIGTPKLQMGRFSPRRLGSAEGPTEAPLPAGEESREQQGCAPRLRRPRWRLGHIALKERLAHRGGRR